MSNDACVLTTGGFSLLELMLEDCSNPNDPLALLLKRKIDSATVVFPEDVSHNVATVSSRVSYSVDGRDLGERVISHDWMTSPVGLVLPVNTVRGLALLGLVEGQEFRLSTHDGAEVNIQLKQVLYQPEAAKRERDARTMLSSLGERRHGLKLVRGHRHDLSKTIRVEPTGFDDPGPSAA